jgi:hypothetical protein
MGVVFGLFSAFYFWIDLFTGLKYSDILGRFHFWLTFVGVNLTFFPMHFMGLAGMPRRIPDYPDIYAGWNFFSSVGSLVSVIGIFVFFFLILEMILQNSSFLKTSNFYFVRLNYFYNLFIFTDVLFFFKYFSLFCYTLWHFTIAVLWFRVYFYILFIIHMPIYLLIFFETYRKYGFYKTLLTSAIYNFELSDIFIEREWFDLNWTQWVTYHLDPEEHWAPSPEHSITFFYIFGPDYSFADTSYNSIRSYFFFKYDFFNKFNNFKYKNLRHNNLFYFYLRFAWHFSFAVPFKFMTEGRMPEFLPICKRYFVKTVAKEVFFFLKRNSNFFSFFTSLQFLFDYFFFSLRDLKKLRQFRRFAETLQLSMVKRNKLSYLRFLLFSKFSQYFFNKNTRFLISSFLKIK